MISSCSTTPKETPFQSYKIRVHYMQQGEKAPFDGYLLNNYTYQRIKQTLKSCKNKQ